jgi:hypothetical protein
MRRMSLVLLLIVVVSSALSVGAHDASAFAGPSAIVFQLGPDRRVMLPKFEENLRIMGALAPGAVLRSDTLGRRGIDVAMFYVKSRHHYDRPLAEIPFALADMRATYYPGRGERPALFVWRPTLNGQFYFKPFIAREGLEVLERYGVPTRETGTSSN